MQEQTHKLIDRANSLVQSDVLRPKAKAFLLLRLCQVYVVFSAEKAHEYWKQLTPLRAHIPADEKPHLDELGLVFEEPKVSGGFAGKMVENIKAMLNKPNLTALELRDFLKASEVEVQKKLLLTGKQAIWEQLVLAWKTIDRQEALRLTAKLSSPIRQMIVRRMNQEKHLSVEEWHSFVDANSQQEATKIILIMLQDPQPDFEIPNAFVVPVATAIYDKLLSPNQLGQVLNQIQKFVHLVTDAESAQHVFEALRLSAKTFATTAVLARHWVDRFDTLLSLIVLGVSSGLITVENMTLFVKGLPAHIIDFCMASCYGLLASDENAEQYLSDLMCAVTKKNEAEAWFLILLAERGLGDLAHTMASKSSQMLQVLPQIRRALLRNDSQAAYDKIPLSEIQDDPVAQLLRRALGRERVEYLREITNGGRQSLPGAFWASEKPKGEDKGFWGSLFSSGKSLDEIVNEYLTRNPLYSSFRVDTPPAQQFAEFLSKRGRYSYHTIDPILLNTLVAWVDDHPNEVELLLKNMWQAIQPGTDLLKLDFLRNAIFSRCTTVFAAAPDVLVQEFLSWLKATLIDSSLTWQYGKTQYTVNYPRTALASMCIQSALAIQEISPDRRDRLVEIALTRFPSNDDLGELGAQLYNTGKATLDLQLPWKTETRIEDGWQLGIVKNAIPSIVKAVIQSESPSA